MEPKPLKLFYFGNCYRYDRPQKGRYREFMQAGCELIGVDTTEAYAELIAMGYKILENIGLKNIHLKIGNLNILSAMFKKIDITSDKQKFLIPLIDKSMFEEVHSALIDFKINPDLASEFIDILTTNDLKKIA
jgi:histidyl-tRNA synthetase